ncbi:CARDB domain-containing protein, partial [Chloroflexota bacterium]
LLMGYCVYGHMAIFRLIYGELRVVNCMRIRYRKSSDGNGKKAALKVFGNILAVVLLVSFSSGIFGVSEIPGSMVSVAHASNLEGNNTGIGELEIDFAPGVPDLIVQSIICVPEYPSLGEDVTFHVTLKNQGSESAGSSRVSLNIDGDNLSSALVEPLPAGATLTKTFNWNVTIGAHNVIAIADANNEVAESDEGNNETAFAFSPLAPDLVIQEITLTPENPSKGDTVYFNVVIKNRGSSQSRFTNVSFYLDDSPRGELDTPALNPGDTVTKSFSWAAKAGTHEARAVVDSKDYVAENDETNNDRVLTFATLAPDLIVEIISWSPEDPSKGDDVTFTVTLKNQGNGRADYSFVAFYVDDESLGSESVDPLEAGASANKTFTWRVKAGTHDIRAVADSNTWLEESDETNNEKVIAFSPLSPDLIIETVTWSPVNPSVGDTVTFTVTIENPGSGRADGSHFAYYIGGSDSGFQTVAVIEPGATATRTFTWLAEAGTRNIKIIADSAKTVDESNEDNNEKLIEFTPIAPDLVIDDISWSPESPLAGDTVTFNVIIKNQSSGKAANSHVALHVGDTFLDSTYVPSIAADATANETFTWTVTAGLHNIRAVADSSDQIAENDETNNERSFTFAPSAPDLVIQNISSSSQSPEAGEKVTFTVTVKNQGNGRAEYSHVVYYVNNTSRGYHEIQEVPSGAAVTKTFIWTAETGQHTVTAVADANENLVESDESNNSKTLSLPPADLVIQGVAWTPENPSVGDSVALTVTIGNQGSGSAGSSRVVYYIDDVAKGYSTVSSINAGAVVPQTFSWIASADSPDIRVVVDADDALAESDEDNNEKTFALIPSVPDLVIQMIDWSIEDPQNVNEVTLNVSIMNEGSSRADSFYLDCYSDGVYLTTTTIEPIDPGSGITETFIWTADAGSHDIMVVLDPNQAIVEGNEDNNEKSITFSTIMPDIVIEKATWVPETPRMEDLVSFYITVRNQGNGRADASRITYYIDDSLKGYYDIPALNADATVSKSFTWIAEAGEHTVRFAVDSGQTVTEIDESNNILEKTFTTKAANAIAINTSGKPAAPGNSMLGGIPMNSWWLMVGGGIMLSVVICVVWLKAK